MARVLVLGSSGRIGAMLRGVWSGNDPVQGTEFLYQTRKQDPLHSTDLLWDVTACPVTPAVVAAGPFDCVLVLSGVVPRKGADLDLNAVLGLAGVNAAATLGAGTVLLASSSAIYGSQNDSPYNEADTPAPANDYGRAKLVMEQQCAAHAQAVGVRLCCLRIGNVAGADALLGNGAALGAGEALRIDEFADGGTPLRSYIGPQTLARVIESLIKARGHLPQTLNVGAPEPIEMTALAKAAQMPFDLVPATGKAHQYITLECAALAAFHNFAPADSDPAQMVLQWQALRGE